MDIVIIGAGLAVMSAAITEMILQWIDSRKKGD